MLWAILYKFMDMQINLLYVVVVVVVVVRSNPPPGLKAMTDLRSALLVWSDRLKKAK